MTHFGSKTNTSGRHNRTKQGPTRTRKGTYKGVHDITLTLKGERALMPFPWLIVALVVLCLLEIGSKLALYFGVLRYTAAGALVTSTDITVTVPLYLAFWAVVMSLLKAGLYYAVTRAVLPDIRLHILLVWLLVLCSDVPYCLMAIVTMLFAPSIVATVMFGLVASIIYSLISAGIVSYGLYRFIAPKALSLGIIAAVVFVMNMVWFIF